MDPEIVQESMGVGEISGIFNELLSACTGDVRWETNSSISSSSQPVDLEQLDPNIDVFDLVAPPPSSTREDLKNVALNTAKPAAATVKSQPPKYELSPKNLEDVSQDSTKVSKVGTSNYSTQSFSPPTFQDISKNAVLKNTVKIEILQNGGEEIIQEAKVEEICL